MRRLAACVAGWIPLLTVTAQVVRAQPLQPPAAQAPTTQIELIVVGGGREAQVSRMMVARMLLERGDAAGALPGFDAYLRVGSGELREDALAGRATALDRLGRDDEGRAAWRTLLDQYPNTAYGAHARSRVEAPVGN